jgi:hypothetical protein
MTLPSALLILFDFNRPHLTAPTMSSTVTETSDVGSSLELRPDPTHFVQLLANANRKDASGSIFIRCLNEYSARAGADVVPSANPLK